MRWVAFDLIRTVAAVALVVAIVTGSDPSAPLAIALGTFVVTSLAVSLFLRPDRA